MGCPATGRQDPLMKLKFPAFQAMTGGAAIVLAAVLLMAPAAPALAWDIDVRTASMGLSDGAWRLAARIDYRLTSKALDALDNGVTLTFRVEIAAARVRRWWLNEELLSLHHDWQLSYEPLTKRYIVTNPDDHEPTSHGTLFGALNALGRIQGLAVAEPGVLVSGESYAVAVRAILDQKTLPGPLQVLAFWDSGFSLESDWYEWTMTP